MRLRAGVAVGWHVPAAAGPIQSLAWELLYATGVALERKEKKNSSEEFPL